MLRPVQRRATLALMETFTTQDMAAIFAISHQAVKNWTKEFADFLTPGATPEAGKTRQYNILDLRVFSLVAELRRQHIPFEDIRLALAAGQRGDIPDTTPATVQKEPHAIVLALRDRISLIENDLTESRNLSEQRLGQVVLLERQLTEREQLIRQLYRELATLEAKLGT